MGRGCPHYCASARVHKLLHPCAVGQATAPLCSSLGQGTALHPWTSYCTLVDRSRLPAPSIHRGRRPGQGAPSAPRGGHVAIHTPPLNTSLGVGVWRVLTPALLMIGGSTSRRFRVLSFFFLECLSKLRILYANKIQWPKKR